jgi:hypothetical protein
MTQHSTVALPGNPDMSQYNCTRSLSVPYDYNIITIALFIIASMNVYYC